MQTFLPYESFRESAKVLDWRRLGKQRVEGMQIINAIENPEKQGWQNHPITVMWRPYLSALKLYTNIIIWELWKKITDTHVCMIIYVMSVRQQRINKAR